MNNTNPPSHKSYFQENTKYVYDHPNLVSNTNLEFRKNKNLGTHSTPHFDSIPINQLTISCTLSL